jgi:alkylation response protein AidB-like acyl-CoA dehydrogenase
VLPGTLTFGPAEAALRSELREWLRGNDPGPPSTDYVETLRDLRHWQCELARAGFMGLSWPERYGGRGLGLAAEAVLAEELAHAGMPELINRLALYTWGPTLLEVGTEEQRHTYLPGMLDASEIWCQGFSEPGAGSDLAAVATTGLVDGDRLVVNGQKVWTSRAEISKWNALLVRSDLDAPRREGLSIVILDMESPGVTVRPLLQMLHEPHFSEVFFDDVEVPLDNVLGGTGNGWSVAMTAMSFERGLFVLERSVRLGRSLAVLRDRLRAEGLTGPDVAARIGPVCSDLEVLRAQVYRTLAAQAAGALRPGSTSVDKLLLTRLDEQLFGTAFDLLGADTSLTDGGWARDLLQSRSVGIYSGTSEIQRNIIARQLLGLGAAS